MIYRAADPGYSRACSPCKFDVAIAVDRNQRRLSVRVRGHVRTFFDRDIDAMHLQLMLLNLSRSYFMELRLEFT
jgi:hypothetical protein